MVISYGRHLYITLKYPIALLEDSSYTDKACLAALATHLRCTRDLFIQLIPFLRLLISSIYSAVTLAGHSSAHGASALSGRLKALVPP